MQRLAVVLVAALVSGGCLTHFAAPYSARIDGASFTVPPPWIATSRGADETQELRTSDGGLIRVPPVVVDPTLAVPSPLNELFLERWWGGIEAERRRKGESQRVLLEQGWMQGSTYPTAQFRFRIVGIAQPVTLTCIFDPPRLAFVTYSGSLSDPVIHIAGYERVVRSFRFEGTSVSRPLAASTTPQTRKFVAPSNVVSVPIQLVEDAILVPVMVNGRQGATFLLDTGSVHTVITPELARRLNVATVGAPTKIITVLGGQQITMPFVRLQLLEVGSSRIEDAEIGVHDVIPQAPIVDGLLGNDILGRFMMTIDRPARQLRLEQGHHTK